MKNSKRLAISIFCLGLIYPLFAQTTGTLSFTCTTAAPSGNWGDKHMAAIWIQNNEDPSVFIKTNAKYGYEDDHLTSWVAISDKNLVDAVTGATLTSYGPISAEWDGTDVSQSVVADGDYSVYIEMGWGVNKVDDHAVSMFTFTKGTSPQTLTPAGTSNFSGISLNWLPTTTLISSVEDNNVNVFPNPSNGVINLNFQEELPDVIIEVSDFSGKILYSEKYQQITLGVKTLDISDMPPGMYLMTIYSDNSYNTYKLVIEK